MKIIGPFKQILTLSNIPYKGAVKDEQLEILTDATLVVKDGKIEDIGKWSTIKEKYPTAQIEEITDDRVLLPGFIDSHTHICFGGKRSKDFAMRLNGKTYLENAECGCGKWSTGSITLKDTMEIWHNYALLRVTRVHDN